jgi:hypothetical protein
MVVKDHGPQGRFGERDFPDENHYINIEYIL